MSKRIQLNRHELAGAFGDMGTSLPLLIGMILASGADPASALIMFGAMQVFSALAYGVPLPAQPLKLVGALVIAHGFDASLMYGAGLALAVATLLLTVTGLLDWLARVIPKPVIRGIQLGVGLKLALTALGYAAAEGWSGGLLAAACTVITLLLFKSRKVPPALVLVALGVAYAVAFGNVRALRIGWELTLPQARLPLPADVLQGFLLLGLVQLPLSLGNSILATRQVAQDLFPEQGITARKIGWTYSIMNLVAPFFSGLPVCHGSGGVVGVHVFGGRTGGATLLYGLLFLVLGVFLGTGSAEVIAVFPLPVLGVLLFIQGVALMALLRDTVHDRTGMTVALVVGLLAVALPHGFLIGIAAGTALAYLLPKAGR